MGVVVAESRECEGVIEALEKDMEDMEDMPEARRRLEAEEEEEAPGTRLEEAKEVMG